MTKRFRGLLGPVAGRLAYRLSRDISSSTVVHGHAMRLASNGGFPPVAMAMGNYEEGTTRLFESSLAPGMVAIDVGAHVGYYSLLAARQVGSEGKVYAFEPEPSNFGLLRANVERNGYRNIVLVNSAAANKEGTTTLYLSALDNGRHSTYRHGLPGAGSIDVQAMTIDDFLATEGWPKVDLVKIDVEGAELDVLEGMRELLQKAGPIKMIVEFNPRLLRNAGVDPIQFLNTPASWGFTVYFIEEKKELTPLDTVDQATLVKDLLKQDTSVNLFCSRE